MANAVNWDVVPDDQLEETWLERLYGLKEMIPAGVRNVASQALTVGWQATKATFGALQNGVWVVSSAAVVMIIPLLMEQEIADMDNQMNRERELLLGSSVEEAGGGGGGK